MHTILAVPGCHYRYHLKITFKAMCKSEFPFDARLFGTKALSCLATGR